MEGGGRRARSAAGEKVSVIEVLDGPEDQGRQSLTKEGTMITYPHHRRRPSSSSTS
ncbi:MAG: hypothetical protein MZU95_01840 [Desulfomicrobium escambiense]|nr:hypothetical protein [Desulfomicrobium escambiense]